MTKPATFTDVDALVEATIAALGRRLVVATPLGIGKPNQLLDAFYRRAQAEPDLELTLLTALSLTKPAADSELGRRLVEPLAERVFAGYTDLAYAVDRLAGKLPDNVRVHEFFFQAGSMLGNVQAQCDYISSNYTHVVRDLEGYQPNVVAQLVAPPEAPGGGFSLSSNPDLTLDLVPMLRRSPGPVRVLGQVNRNLPFMGGDAEVPASFFDGVLEAPGLDFPLFGPPNPPVTDAEYLIGLYASTLIKDGGTLQIGIGSLGDAVTRMLELRHSEPEAYRRLTAAAEVPARYGELIAAWGGLEPFDQGLYAASEMLVDGFLALLRAGILKRRVYADATVQELVDDGRLDPRRVDEQTLEALLEAGVVGTPLDAAAVALLRDLGVLRQDVRLEGDGLVDDAGGRALADLGTAAGRQAMLALAGEALRGHVAHAGFFLGPRSFYRDLRQLPPATRREIAMTSVLEVNQLYGDEDLRRAQRRFARFLNTGMVATLGGAVASDGLDDGRVLSGVGGQYNFVAMAHALGDGRSVIMLRSVRESEGETRSNLVASYGHVTIPRHLRDILVTEYGIADLRGKTDRQVVEATLAIADARFVDELVAAAQRSRKLPKDFRVPDRWRQNRPERVRALLAPLEKQGLIGMFPYGSDLTEEEVVLGRALKRLEAMVERRRPMWPGGRGLAALLRPPAAARPYLVRMGLERPSSLRERLLARAVVYALLADGML